MRDIDVVLASFARCCAQPNFLDVFFKELMKSGEVRTLLKHVSEPKQKKVLRLGICYIIMFVDGWSVGKFAMEYLAGTHGHRGMNINPNLYMLWVDALMFSVAKHDPEFTSESNQAWRMVISKGITKLKSEYKRAAA